MTVAFQNGFSSYFSSSVMSLVTTHETVLPQDLNLEHISRTSSHKDDHLEPETFKFTFMLFANLQIDMGMKITVTYFDQGCLCTSTHQPHSASFHCLFCYSRHYEYAVYGQDRVREGTDNLLCFAFTCYSSVFECYLFCVKDQMRDTF